MSLLATGHVAKACNNNNALRYHDDSCRFPVAGHREVGREPARKHVGITLLQRNSSFTDTARRQEAESFAVRWFWRSVGRSASPLQSCAQLASLRLSVRL
jgi:hypothetical protein